MQAAKYFETPRTHSRRPGFSFFVRRCPIHPGRVTPGFIALGQRSDTHSPQTILLPAAKQQPLQVTTEIVKLDATVTDERGEFISGLRQSDFRILDRGAEQPIVFFAPTDAPAQILVMVETSPAVYLIQSDHIAAVYAACAPASAPMTKSLSSPTTTPHALFFPSPRTKPHSPPHSSKFNTPSASAI